MAVVLIQMQRVAQTNSTAVHKVTPAMEVKLIKYFISTAFDLKKYIMNRYHAVNT